MLIFNFLSTFLLIVFQLFVLPLRDAWCVRACVRAWEKRVLVVGWGMLVGGLGEIEEEEEEEQHVVAMARLYQRIRLHAIRSVASTP